MRILTILCICLLPLTIFAQYEPEIDAIGKDDVTDGGELQLATPSLDHYLRFFGGRGGDPNPFIYFSDMDTLSIANGNNLFSNFTNLLRVYPNGEFATKWGTAFYHYDPTWTSYPKLPYLNKGWDGTHYDFMYLGSTGNRSNDVQGAIMLSHMQGVQFGKGHDDGDTLSRVDMTIDSGGVVSIRDLEGIGDAHVVVDSLGKLKRSSKINYYTIPASAFQPTYNDTITWIANASEAYFEEQVDFRGLAAPIHLPHESTVLSITILFIDDDPDSNTYSFTKMDKATGSPTSVSSFLTAGDTSTPVAGFASTNIKIDNLSNSYTYEMVPNLGVGLNANFRIKAVTFEWVE